MYRQQRSSGLSAIFIVVLVGTFIGVGYLILDRQPQQTPPPTEAIVESIETPLPAEAVLVADTANAAGLSQFEEVPIANQELTFGARFLAPTAGINSHVVESYLDGNSWDVRDLGPQVGHLQGTAWTHTPGNIVLAGHVEMTDGRPGIFASINQMSIGDPLIIMQDGAEHTYQITQMFHTEPDDLSVMYPTTSERLTLVTCSNYSFLADEYRDRFIVIADRVS